MMNPSLSAVIMVTCARDLRVNRISIPAVIENIRARAYSIVVPQPDLPQFRESLPGEATLIAEEELLHGWTIPRIARSLPASVAQRAGWYYQQLLKIEAVRQLPASAEALIWDADTVPLRPMNFKDAGDRIGFYVGREHHQPYFDTTRRLLGMESPAPYSFIAQCMYTRVNWVHDMLALIERRSTQDWIDAILSAIPGCSPSEFSEYETIGTFIAMNHGAEIHINTRRWFRWGMAHFGSIDQVTVAGLQRLARRYDYVALESWDHGGAAWLRSRRQRVVDRFWRPRFLDG